MKVLVTGGAGFIGSHLVAELVAQDHEVTVLDKLTYAGQRTLPVLVDLWPHGIEERGIVRRLIDQKRPAVCFHLAAETHVARSIETAEAFIDANIRGTFILLDEWLRWQNTPGWVEEYKPRFIHVSTDEVYGSLPPAGIPWGEWARYAPNNPYSASKAASDHLVHAWMHTHGLSTNILHLSNVYGPRQHWEKLIPAVIKAAYHDQPILIHGDGQQMRDWLHVEAAVRAILWVWENGEANRTYNVPGDCERTNLDIMTMLMWAMREKVRTDFKLSFVADRPGNDRRYAMMSSIPSWDPGPPIEQRIEPVVDWYIQRLGGVLV